MYEIRHLNNTMWLNMFFCWLWIVAVDCVVINKCQRRKKKENGINAMVVGANARMWLSKKGFNIWLSNECLGMITVAQSISYVCRRQCIWMECTHMNTYFDCSLSPPAINRASRFHFWLNGDDDYCVQMLLHCMIAGGFVRSLTNVHPSPFN